MAEELKVSETSETPLGGQPNVGKTELSADDRKAQAQANHDLAVKTLDEVVTYLDGKFKGLGTDLHVDLNAARGLLDHYRSRLRYDLNQMKGE